ncbi:MAG: RnfABCDGE type electron transport complex subunit B [Bacteroidales bacterium]|nr:RnfABCDGE type electron transport complex subunit B [Candidatus Physcousia equi]
MNVIQIAVIVLGSIGLVSAVILFFASKKFAVHEDPRIGEVAAVLPQANCGGCGYPGCGGFANACVKASASGSLGDLNCAPGGKEVMEKVACILGLQASAASPKVAVVRCSGTCDARPHAVVYDGAHTCRIQSMTGMGETQCLYGCLGEGDCVRACLFGAIQVNPETGIAEVDETKCTGCGACQKACPRGLIELRPVGPKGRRVVVLCNNKDKGIIATKVCKNSCIGCGKCVKTCEKFEAITLEANLAYIDPEKCKLCRKCEEVCPRGVIKGFNFPPKKAAAPAPGTAEHTAVPASRTAEPATPAVSAPASDASSPTNSNESTKQ